MKKLILITGGSASGKTTLARKISTSLKKKVLLVSQDSYYLQKLPKNVTYDMPSALDHAALAQTITNLLQNQLVKLPIYNYSTAQISHYETINPNQFEYIILEGIHSFFDPVLRQKAALKIFVDTASDTRLARRIKRDMNERDRTITSILEQWANEVQPSFREYIAKQKYNADIIVPFHRINKVGTQSIIFTILNI